MRILVIEDEIRTGDYLRRGLTECGFVVDVARNGPEGMHFAREITYDAVLLDVMLPGANGWEVITEIKRISQAPVIFLSARNDVADRLRGFELGADDYLGKPFAFAELLARLRRSVRQAPAREPELLTIADLEIDVIARRVSRGGRRVDVTAQEFTLLHLLARRCGEVLSRPFIASQVWDINFDTDNNVVGVAVRRLRAKIDEPFDRKLIHTVRGMGYVLDPNREEDSV